MTHLCFLPSWITISLARGLGKRERFDIVARSGKATNSASDRCDCAVAHVKHGKGEHTRAKDSAYY